MHYETVAVFYWTSLKWLNDEGKKKTLTENNFGKISKNVFTFYYLYVYFKLEYLKKWGASNNNFKFVNSPENKSSLTQTKSCIKELCWI